MIDRARWASICIVALIACASHDGRPRAAAVDTQRQPARAPARVEAVSPASSTPFSDKDSLVMPAEIPADVRVACDSAAAFVREALGLRVRREEGRYTDVSWGTSRTGCRLRAPGSLKAVLGSGGPTEMLDSAFVHHGWSPDFHFGADGADGATMGMRRGNQLCFVTGRWKGGDESAPDTTRQAALEEDEYWIVVECGRSVPAGPDTL